MSHISSYSNNYASNLKLKDVTLYFRVFKGNSPCIAMYFIIGTYMYTYVRMYTGTVRVVSCRLCVQCMQCARGSRLFRTQYHVPFPRVVIDLHSTIFLLLAVWSSVMMLHIHVFWGWCFTGARLWNRSAFLMGLGKGISFLNESPIHDE